MLIPIFTGEKVYLLLCYEIIISFLLKMDGRLSQRYPEAIPVAFPSTTPLIIYEAMTTSIFTWAKPILQD